MMLKSLTLQNFRSYGEDPVRIDFDRGILLFEGDIGSGKSTILYAIEFALFGLGEVEARFMLRGSAPSAKVELEFEVGNNEYKIVRTIERRKGSNSIQTRGWISEANGKDEELKPTELKLKILQILNFREKSGKSSSRIYRYAVFTPQELMKEVLNQRSEDRIETLRRAFGIEDYSFVSNNSAIVISRLNNLTKINAAEAKSLPAKEEMLRKAKENLEKNMVELSIESDALSHLSQNIDEVRLRLSELEIERDRARNLQTLIPQLEKNLAETQSQFLDSHGQLERYESNLKEVRNAALIMSRLKQDYADYLEARNKLRGVEDIQDKNLEMERKISELSKNILTKEVALKTEFSSIEGEKRRLESTLSQYERDILLLPKYEAKTRDLDELVKIVPELQRKIDGMNLEIGNFKATIQFNQSEAKKIEAQLRGLADISNETLCPLCNQKLTPEHLKDVRADLDSKLDSFKIQLARFSARLAILQKERDDLATRIEKTHKERNHMEKEKRELGRLEQARALLKETGDAIAVLDVRIREIQLDLQSRDFVHSEEVQLSSLKLKREAFVGPLKALAQLRSFIKKCDDSDLEKTYLNSERLAATEDEAERLVLNQKENVGKLEDLIKAKNQEIRSQREVLEQLEPSILEYQKLRQQLEELEKSKEQAKTRLATFQANVSNLKSVVEPLEIEVEALRKRGARSSFYRGNSSWLETLFVPAVENIETYVLDSIREEFQRVFHRWFAALVEDPNMSVSVDDRFTPIVVQSGYELDAQSLSGGERTAIALAYRLALNYLVKRANESMQTNLLILDEPTEGFSKEQTYRLRDVLEELECDQVVLVSHERDLESLAERIYRVEKIDGMTSVKLV